MFKSRRTSTLVFTLALALTTLGTDALFSQGRPAARRTVLLDGREVVEGEVLVRYRAESGRIERERAEFQANSDGSEPIGRLGARRMRSRHLTTRAMLAELRANPDIEVAEPNYIVRANATPNDPSFGSLWGLLNTGQTVDGQAGAPGADIGAVQAWDVTTGSRSNIVAVIDTGIDWTHPDLAANMFSAPRAFAVTVGALTINCAAGTHGFNSLTNTCNPFDDNGHGTHVAGIIGAVGNNGVGVTGVNWVANMMALKVLGVDGAGTTSDAIKAIQFAINTKAALGADGNIRVLNASWGGNNFSQLLSDEIEAANNADMLFVASAGTTVNDNDITPHYPASYSSSNVLSVTAVDNTGEWDSFSNYGATSVHLAAPGATVLSTFPNNTYGELSGTSMAAPYVAGAAALILSACPMDTAGLKSTLLSTITPVASLSSRTTSGGRLDVDAALQGCLPTLHATISGTTITATVGNGTGYARDWLGLFCPASGGDGSSIDWKYLNGTRTAPSSGMASATVAFQAPSQAANCNVRLFSNDQLIKIATSETVSLVQPSTLTIDDVSITEGNSGTATATFTVTLSPANASQTVTVSYATANGTATTGGGDYTATSGTLTFAPSAVTRTISVPVAGDATFEPNETFAVNLSAPINAVIGDAQGIATIVNDDAAPPATITVPESVAPGAAITVNVTNGPGNATDWVGLFLTTGSDESSISWMYLNGTRTAPASGTSSATVQFTAPATTGNYNVRLFANNTLTKVGTSNTVTVAAQQPSSPTLTIPSTATPGGAITVTLSNGPGSATDWIALFPSGGNDDSYVDWKYLNGTRTAPASGLTSATVQFTAPSGGGTYNVRMFANNTLTKIATSNTVTVGSSPQPSSPTITIPSTATPGSAITVNISNGPGGATDWIGLFPSGGDDQSYVHWMYLNGTRTPPASGSTSATVQFTAPSGGGTYNVRMFASNTTTKIATSNTVTVAASQQPPGPTIAVTSSVTPGGTITVNITNGPGSATDWIALFPSTGNDESYVTWMYLNGTRTAPASGMTTATLQLTAPQNGGTYNVRMFANNTLTKIATSGDITVANSQQSSGPSIAVPQSVTPGGAISVTITNGPGSPTDWIALFPANSDDTSYVHWMYLNGTRVAPASGSTNATVQFTAPATAGTYNVRMFANNSTTKIATSSTITVAP